MGVQALHADTCDEAADLIRSQPVHIALVDVDIPLHRGGGGSPAGPRVLQLLRRLDPSPPTVVIRPRQATGRESARGLVSSLREGAVAVIDRPLHLEVLLQTLQRVLRRHYKDTWPTAHPGTA